MVGTIKTVKFLICLSTKDGVYRRCCKLVSILVQFPLGEVGCGGIDWIDLAEDRDHWRPLVNTLMNLQVP
jgi:hypothetical protein